MRILQLTLLISTVVLLFSCNQKEENNAVKSSTTFNITNLTDDAYPDNPDIGFRSTNYQQEYFTTGILDSIGGATISFHFISTTKDTISILDMDVSELIPTIPSPIKNDEYLSYITCVNQEWNRNQVKLLKNQFLATDSTIVRVDIARNCLNAYLWEIIAYIHENGKEVPYAHGWFDFPHSLYANLFQAKNSIPFEKYEPALVNWIDPESRTLDLQKLRTKLNQLNIKYDDKSDTLYPLKGARLKKRKEIIYPNEFKTMRDLQSDSTLFATFSPPGYYNKKDPRKTELGRFRHLQYAELHHIVSSINGDTLYELKLTFMDKDKNRTTQLFLGGLNFNDFPVLPEEEANNGWKTSMGIANHSFYEDYQSHLKNKTLSNGYYGLLLDKEGKWLDSHKIGIDGPIFHFTDASRKELHLWLLSFERHALVGHYRISIN